MAMRPAFVDALCCEARALATLRAILLDGSAARLKGYPVQANSDAPARDLTSLLDVTGFLFASKARGAEEDDGGTQERGGAKGGITVAKS